MSKASGIGHKVVWKEMTGHDNHWIGFNKMIGFDGSESPNVAIGRFDPNGNPIEGKYFLTRGWGETEDEAVISAIKTWEKLLNMHRREADVATKKADVYEAGLITLRARLERNETSDSTVREALD